MLIIRGTQIQNCKSMPLLEKCRNPPLCVLPAEICANSQNCQSALNDQTDNSPKWVIPVVLCTVLVIIFFIGMLYLRMYRRFKERKEDFKDNSIYNIPNNKLADTPSIKQEANPRQSALAKS